MKVAERLFHIPAIAMAVAVIFIFLGATVPVDARPLTADFNGDGFDDLAVGAPDEDLGSSSGTIFDAGAVNVLYGSAGGLSAAGDQLWHQGRPGVEGAAKPNDGFGAALAVGDFDNDGFDDLAVGVPHDNLAASVKTVPVAGAVNVLYGSAGGLSAAGDQLWHQNSQGVKNVAEFGDAFGWALTAGDFDNDGFDDLAVGIPREDIKTRSGTIFETGAVNVLYGSAGGLSDAGNQFWHQNKPGVRGAAKPGKNLGWALTAGDFDNDGFDDLAVGVPFLAGSGGDGAVNVLYGSAGGLSATGNQLWHQNRPGVKEVAERNDGFGSALTAGDFDNDGFDDLAVGVPREDIRTGSGAIRDAGAVNVLYGSAAGLIAAGNQLWHRKKTGVRGAARRRDTFGWALAAADFDNDGFDDLAVGVPRDDFKSGSGTIRDAGAVNVLYGAAGGLSAARDQLWHQNKPGVKEAAQKGDLFGWALATGDFDNDNRDDLAVGVILESVGSTEDAGAVNLLYGAATGLNAAGDQLWHQNVAGVAEVAQTGDHFGNALPLSSYPFRVPR
jgi:disulfide bond formation protein DsbB